jgi:hypothetical protein
MDVNVNALSLVLIAFFARCGWELFDGLVFVLSRIFS